MAYFSPELWTARIQYGSPNSSVLRDLRTLTTLGLCSSSRTGERNRFRNRHIELRYFHPSQPFLHSATCRKTREWVGNPGFLRLRFCLWTPAWPRLERKSPKVSSLVCEYSLFEETMGGDWFERDCRPRTAVDFTPWRRCASGKAERIPIICNALCPGDCCGNTRAA